MTNDLDPNYTMKNFPKNPFLYCMLSFICYCQPIHAFPCDTKAASSSTSLKTLFITFCTLWTMRSNTGVEATSYAWERAFETNGNGISTALAVANDERYFFTGYTDTFNGTDLWVAEFNSMGDSQWYHSIQGSNHTKGRAVMAIPDDRLAILGEIRNQQDTDILWLLYNASRHLKWAKGIGGVQDDYGTFFLPMEGDRFLMTGKNMNATTSNGFIAVLDGEGEWMWGTSLEKSFGYQGTPVAITNTQHIVLAGHPSNDSYDDVHVATLNGTGYFDWGQKISTNLTGVSDARVVHHNGRFFIIRYVKQNASSSQRGLLVIRYNAMKALTWAKIFTEETNMLYNNAPIAADSTEEGGIIVSWSVSNSTSGEMYTVTAQLSRQGNPQWAKIFDTKDRIAHNLAFGLQREIMISGEASYGNTKHHPWVAKLLRDGVGCGSFITLNVADITSSLIVTDIVSLTTHPLYLPTYDLNLSSTPFMPNETTLCDHTITTTTHAPTADPTSSTMTSTTTTTLSPTRAAQEDDTLSQAQNIAYAFLAIVATSIVTVTLYFTIKCIGQSYYTRKKKRRAFERTRPSTEVIKKNDGTSYFINHRNGDTVMYR